MSGCGGVGLGRATAGGSRLAYRGLVSADRACLQMLTMLTTGGPGERARPLQVRPRACVAPPPGDDGNALCLPPLSPGMPKALGGLGWSRWDGEPLSQALVCRHGGAVLEAHEGATGGPPEAAEEGGKCQRCQIPSSPWHQIVPSQMFSLQRAERWLPRAEALWTAEEDHLEDSLEDLGAAGGCLLGRARGLNTRCPLTCLLLGWPRLPADDFLEPEAYAETEGSEPGVAADPGTCERVASQGVVRGLRMGRRMGDTFGHSSSHLPVLQKQMPCRCP